MGAFEVPDIPLGNRCCWSAERSAMQQINGPLVVDASKRHSRPWLWPRFRLCHRTVLRLLRVRYLRQNELRWPRFLRDLSDFNCIYPTKMSLNKQHFALYRKGFNREMSITHRRDSRIDESKYLTRRVREMTGAQNPHPSNFRKLVLGCIEAKFKFCK